MLNAPRVRGIVVAYTVNRLGTWMGYVALSVAVFDKTHSATAVAALLVAAQVLPALAVPAVVARVESSRRQTELSSLYFFEAAVTAGLIVLLSHFSLPLVLLLVALDGTAALSANALLRAALADAAREWAAEQEDPDVATVSEERSPRALDAEQRANAALNLGFSISFALGPALGGVVIAASGPRLALIVDAVSFVLCGAMLVRVRPHVAKAAGESVRARLRAALDHINEVPGLRALLLTEAVAIVFFASGAPIEVAYAKLTLGTGDWGYGVLLGVWGVGTVAGSVGFARRGRRRLGAMLVLGTLAVGLGYVGFAAAPGLGLAFVAALVGGAGNGVQWASLVGAVQRLTPQALQGRLMGAVEAMSALCPAIGLALGGVLVAVSSPRTAFLVVGIGAVAVTGAFLALTRWTLDLGDAGEALPGGEVAAPLAGTVRRRTLRRRERQREDSRS